MSFSDVQNQPSRIIHHENSPDTEQSRGNRFISCHKRDLGIYNKVQFVT